MIAQSWLGAVLECAPGRVIAILEFFGTPLFVGQVAGSEYRARDPFDQLGRGLGAFDVLAGSDVAGANQSNRLMGISRRGGAGLCVNRQ